MISKRIGWPDLPTKTKASLIWLDCEVLQSLRAKILFYSQIQLLC